MDHLENSEMKNSEMDNTQEYEQIEFHIEEPEDLEKLKAQEDVKVQPDEPESDQKRSQEPDHVEENSQVKEKFKQSIKKSKSGHYIPGLDGLRAIAVGGVVLFHLFPGIIKGGYLGVVLFFVISGYLMVITSEADWEKNNFTFFHFYKKRLRRIYPALMVTVVLFTVFTAIVIPKDLGGIRSEILSITFGYNNWWQIAQNASYFSKSAAASPFTHLWSLAIELQYYLIWPVLFILYKKASKICDQKKTDYAFLVVAVASGILMAILYKPNVDPSRIYYGTDTRIFALLMGAFVGIKHREFQNRTYKDNEKGLLNTIFLLCTAGILYCYVSMSGESAITYRGGMFLTSILFAVIVMLTGCRGLSVGRWLDHKALNWFGKRSYEIYLIQYPVIFFWSKIRPETENVFLPLIPAVIILVLAAVLHYALDKKNQREFMGYFKHHKKYAALGIGIVLVILGIFTYALATAEPDRLSEDQRKLQQELEQNAQMLEEQKAKAEAAKKEAEEEKPTEDPLSQSVTIIGDSVVLGAAPALQANIPHAVIDAVEGRQVNECLGIMQSLDSQGLLGKTVIIGLGANGPFSPEEGQAVLDYLGKDRRVYWITVCGPDISWRDNVNAVIKDLAKKNKRVKAIGWDEAGPASPQWFYDDGIHLNPDGQNGFASFIINDIRSDIVPKEQEKTEEKQSDDKETKETQSLKDQKNKK